MKILLAFSHRTDGKVLGFLFRNWKHLPKPEQSVLLRLIDLFAGVGGMTQVFEELIGSDGNRLFEPLPLVDWNAPARETQIRNNPKTRY